MGIEAQALFQHRDGPVRLTLLPQFLRESRARVILAGKLLEEGFEDLDSLRLVSGNKSLLGLKVQQVLAWQARLELLNLGPKFLRPANISQGIVAPGKAVVGQRELRIQANGFLHLVNRIFDEKAVGQIHPTLIMPVGF